MQHFAMLGLLSVLLLSSCASFSWMSSTLWDGNKQRGTKPEHTERASIALGIEHISIDRVLGTTSVQNEMTKLVEMLILESGYRIAYEKDKARYSLAIDAVEREFIQGWQNRRSVSITVWIWDNAAQDSIREKPIAIGRAVTTGTKSLASSWDLEQLLRKALIPVLDRDLEP
jgi:hypothetical protein